RAVMDVTPLGLPRPAAIAFDCDGLLVETESCWSEALVAMFAAHGREFTPALKADLIGTTVDYNVELMAQWFDRPGAEAALKAELLATVAEVIGERAEPMPGAVELARWAAARLPVAVVSNSARHLVELSLARAGLTDVLTVIVAGEDVVDGKPAPDPYLRACELLAVAPAAAVAFEDSRVGVDAARAAGLTVIGVPTVVQDGFAPHVELASLTDPALIAWAQTW
ncbi:MAG: HAD family phosphatase, partial [Propionibacteriales bacterium]|nr:HAD family phosphatase [Propionibacteriales bacterium]